MPLPSKWAIPSALIIFSALGCGPKPPLKNIDDSEKEADSKGLMRLDPIHVTADRDEERLVIDAYDASGLFSRGAENLRAGQCEDAVIIYRRLVAEFPDSRFASPSLYNAGLCNEQVERFQEAVSDYSSLIEKYPESRDVTDAMFRLAGAYEKLEAWEDAVTAYSSLLTEREDLEGIERIEALARKGSCLVQLKDPDEARVALNEALALFKLGKDLPETVSTFYYAMAQFKLGEIVDAKMRAAQLPADEAVLEEALEKKCQLLLDAQAEYTNAIKIGHPHWAAAAAYRIGNLYRNLWDDMLNAPVPQDLNDEEKEIYLEVLKKKIRNLLTKAARQWERTLKMARRLNLSNEWVKRTSADLEDIRALMELEDEASAQSNQ